MPTTTFKTYLEALNYEEKGPLVIGLTGYTGAGSSTTKNILISNTKISYPGYEAINPKNNPQEKYLDSETDERVYNKLKRNWEDVKWQPFVQIEVSKVIFAFLLKKLMLDGTPNDQYENSKFNDIITYVREQKFNLEGIKNFFIKSSDLNSQTATELISAYKNILSIYKHFKDNYPKRELGIFIELLQDLGDEIRRYGKVVDKRPDGIEISPNNIYTIPNALDRLIKAYTLLEKSQNFVIDTLKNPYEVEFFKHHYNQFFLVGIMRDEKERKDSLKEKLHPIDVEKIDDREKVKGTKKSKENLNLWITSQDIEECLKKADMYIANKQSKAFEYLRFGIVKLLTLINKPGCVPPSQDERCMQLAMTVRLSSGCISRQVGAVILNSEKSVIGTGWNDPPIGQIPCSLRSCNELINNATPEVFSEFERGNDFVGHVRTLGLGDKPFCFREEYANMKHALKQAEYTRALHSEENALFQAIKNSPDTIMGSILYTSSSPCTLCAKKSIQLGIERIVFIDEYYDIAIDQTIKAGTRKVILERFSGAYFTQIDPPVSLQIDPPCFA